MFRPERVLKAYGTCFFMDKLHRDPLAGRDGNAGSAYNLEVNYDFAGYARNISDIDTFAELLFDLAK